MSSTVNSTTSSTAHHDVSLPVGSDGLGGIAHLTWAESRSIVLEGDPAARHNVLRAVAAHARLHGNTVIDATEVAADAHQQLWVAEHALMDRLAAAQEWQVSNSGWRQVVVLVDAASTPDAERLVRCVLNCGDSIHATVVFGVDQCDGPRWSHAAGARVVQVATASPEGTPAPRDTFAAELVFVAA